MTLTAVGLGAALVGFLVMLGIVLLTRYSRATAAAAMVAIGISALGLSAVIVSAVL